MSHLMRAWFTTPKANGGQEQSAGRTLSKVASGGPAVTRPYSWKLPYLVESTLAKASWNSEMAHQEGTGVHWKVAASRSMI